MRFFSQIIKVSCKISQRGFSGVFRAAYTFPHHFHWGGSRSFLSMLSWWTKPKHTSLLIAQAQVIPDQFLFCFHFLPSWSQPFLGCQVADYAHGPLHCISASPVSPQFLYYFPNFLLSWGISPASQIPK